MGTSVGIKGSGYTGFLTGRAIDQSNVRGGAAAGGLIESALPFYADQAYTAGTIVHIPSPSGWNTGTRLWGVAKSNASSATKPATYVVLEDVASGGIGAMAPAGKVKIAALDGSSFTAGNPVFLSTTDGTVTLTAAAGLPVVGYLAEATNPAIVAFNLRATAERPLTSLPYRAKLSWQAGQRGKPGLNADIQNAAEATRMIADPDFELLGTNATSGSSAFNAEGGITLTTAGADNDQVILLPHLDASQSAWAQWTWGTDKQTEWECDIVSGANITSAIIWCGLKLTNTSTTATDNDQVFFRYQDTVNSGKWQAIYSIANTDTATDTGVTAVVSTRTNFKITIDASRIARMYLNGKLVATSTALTDATDLIPYIGVQASGAAAAKAITVYGQEISRIRG